MRRSTRKQSCAGRGYGAEDLIVQLERIAFADVRRLCQPTGEPLPLDRISAEDAVAIKAVRRRKWTNKDGRPGGETILELHDKLKALELLGDHLGAWDQHRRGDGVRVVVLQPGQAPLMQLGPGEIDGGSG